MKDRLVDVVGRRRASVFDVTSLTAVFLLSKASSGWVSLQLARAASNEGSTQILIRELNIFMS